MPASTYSSFSSRQTPQNQPIPGKDMTQNSAGGYSFAVDDWTRLERFLILGSEGGTYYVNEQSLTKENAEAVLRCIQADGPRTVSTIIQISESGRAAKNDPALFALAMCFGLGDSNTRKGAELALPRVARIGTHLFNFATYVQNFRGWGRSLKRAVADWYQDKDAEKLAFQVVKYRQRNGWTHRDLLRLSHPKPKDETTAKIYRWITQGDIDPGNSTIIDGYLYAQEASKPLPSLVETYGLTWEMLPTEWLRSPEVWDELLDQIPATALIRNLGRMGSIGLLKPMSDASSRVIEKLSSEDYIKRSRLHPLTILNALSTYSAGHGMRGSLSWTPVPQVKDALDNAFHLSFQNVEPTGKRHLLGLDVSGSMTCSISGSPLSCREASAALAMVTARLESQYHIMGFTGNFVPLDITANSSLSDAVSSISRLPFGRTDCAIPMIWAKENKIEVDAFVIYTDSETWYGRIHPCQALQAYREATGIPAKLIVNGMVSNMHSIADPEDSGTLDVVGFDTATPSLMADFIRQ